MELLKDDIFKRVREGLGDSVTFFIARSDGVLLFEYYGSKSSLRPDSISTSVLMCGAWQASEALMGNLNEQQLEKFRFSFDTSDQGVYVLPIINGKQRFLAGLVYAAEVNPAYLKQRMKKLVTNLSREALTIFPREVKNIGTSNTRQGFLFEDISDDEIDALFKFAGG